MAEQQPRPEAQTTLYQVGQEEQAREAQEIARPEAHTSLHPAAEAKEGREEGPQPVTPETETTLRPADPTASDEQ